MRLPGLAEILLIIIVAGIVLLGIKIFGTPPPSKARKVIQYEDVEEEEDYDERVKQTRRSRAQIFGIVAIVLGVIIMLSTLSLVKWVFWGPIGAFIIVVIGLATILIARRSR